MRKSERRTLLRHSTWAGLPAEAVRGVNSQMALWKCVRRAPDFPQRAGAAIERLAVRLQARSTQAYLRRDRAEELGLSDLKAADRWWQRQWEREEADGTGPEG